MSLIAKLEEDITEISNILNVYRSHLEGCEDKLAIEGKRLSDAIRENASWQFYYSSKCDDLRQVLSFIELQVNKVRGNLYRRITEKSNIDLTDKGKERYIEREDSYIDMCLLYADVKNVYDKYCSVVDAFKVRGYALNNMTRILMMKSENDTI